jgi:hypothetical protein
MKILQVIVGAPPASRVVQDFTMGAALSAQMDLGKVLEEKP